MVKDFGDGLGGGQDWGSFFGDGVDDSQTSDAGAGDCSPEVFSLDDGDAPARDAKLEASKAETARLRNEVAASREEVRRLRARLDELDNTQEMRFSGGIAMAASTAGA